MTTPLPAVQYGNTASDIGSAVSSFAKGLQDERARRREEAMAMALKNLQVARLIKPEFYQEQTFNPASGLLEYAYVDKMNPTQVTYTGREAKNPNFISTWMGQNGIPQNVASPRYVQGGGAPGANPIQSPQGLDPKGFQPIPIVVDFGQGPMTIFVDPAQAAAMFRQQQGGIGGNPIPAPSTPNPAQVPQAPQSPVQQPVRPVQSPVAPVQQPAQPQQPVAGTGGMFPRAPDNLDEQKASRAFMTIQGRYNMIEALKIDPQAYNDAAAFIAAGKVAEGLPIFGNSIQEFVNANAGSLSPAAQRYLNGVLQVGAMIAFASGGTALTRTELNAALGSVAPVPNEVPEMRIQKDNNLRSYLAAATRGNNAWPRFLPLLGQFKWTEENATNFTMPPQAPDPFAGNSILQGIKAKRPR